MDVFGTFEVFINADGARVLLFSLDGPGVKVDEGGVWVEAVGPEDIGPRGVLLIPGGSGTRTLIGNDQWTGQLAGLAASSPQVMTVCTGSALLAAADVPDNPRATSNDLAFAEDACGPEADDKVIVQMEYIRNRDSGYDPFG